MWNYFFKSKYKKISFEDIQFAIKHPDNFIIINTLPLEEQNCLIKHTISYQTEENIINRMMQEYDYKSSKFIIYGKNSTDSTIEKKYEQLSGLGFLNVYLYIGGVFEWLLLQDIYGSEEFPTTSKMIDILKYKPTRAFGIMKMIGN